MNGLMQDVRYAVRQLRLSAGFSVIVVLTLALTIGMSTAVFSSIDAVLIRPLPFDHPEMTVPPLSRVWKKVSLSTSVATASWMMYRVTTPL